MGRRVLSDRGLWFLVVVLIGSSAAPGATGSARYTFTPIAARGDVFSTFGSSPSVNNAGSVAFTTILADHNTYAVWTADGVSARQVYTPGSSQQGFGSVQSGPTINDSGWVALGSYTGTNDVWVTDGTSIQHVHPGIVISPSINNARKVAFAADLAGGLEGVGVWDNGAIVWVADVQHGFSSVSEPVLNESDVVTFLGLTGADVAIYRGAGGAGAVSSLARVIGQGDIIRAGQRITALGNGPTIDDAGRVVTWAQDAGGVRGLYRFAPDGGVETLASSAGAFNEFTSEFGSRAALNATGGIVFYATLDDGRGGLFTGPDPVNDRVLLAGDLLFGRTVSDVVLGPAGLNDAGQVAFQVLFEDDGGNVIVRADPIPEPAPGAMLGLGAGLSAGVARRRPRRRARGRFSTAAPNVPARRRASSGP